MTQQEGLADVPLRIGAPEDFACVEDALRSTGFDDGGVCRALKIPHMCDLGSAKAEEIDFPAMSAELALFIRLFLMTQNVARHELERILPPEVTQCFLRLGLLRLGRVGDVECYHTPVLFYPVEGFWIASDRRDLPAEMGGSDLPDAVFPAIYVGTLRFLRLISGSPAGDALDVCGGSGIGAFVLSRHSKRAVTADLSARAAYYARFNRMLNRCQNVEVVQGDLFDPVAGQTFDRIVAHPPYVPAPVSRMLWRDAGETGEFLVRRIVEAVPKYLSPGGTFLMLAMGLDTRKGLFEERARGWLGEAGDEFDIVLGLAEERSPKQILGYIRERMHSDPSEIGQIGDALEREETTGIAYGALWMYRRGNVSGKPWTTRLKMSEKTQGGDFEWALSWHRRRSQPQFLETISHARPRLSEHMLLNILHAVVDGSFVAAEAELETLRPFLGQSRIDWWMVPLVGEFKGKRTPSEIYEAARAAGSLPAGYELGDFLSLVDRLLERGYLILDDETSAGRNSSAASAPEQIT